MKTNSKIVHEYAHQIFTGGKGSNLFYEGPTLYSYGHHFPICHIAIGHDGEKILFWNPASYSNTTGKHKTKALYATRHLNRITVPDIHAAMILRINTDDIAPLVRAWKEKVAAMMPEIEHKSSAKRLKSYYELTSLESDIFRFVRDFLGQPAQDPVNTIYVNWDFYRDLIVKLNAYRTTVRDTDEAKREKRSEAAYKAAQTRSERRVARFSRHYITPEERIQAWREGAPGGIRVETDLIRQLPSGIIQTSQGVELSSIDAVSIYSAIISGQLTQGVTVLDHYTVSKCDPEDTHIGCHRFKTQYLIKAGEAINAGDWETLKTL